MNIRNNTPLNYRFFPDFDPVEFPEVRAICYEGQPLEGHRTEVFAYIGFPENTSGPVPGVVLIHGGDGHAYGQWVAQWVRKGYAAIAMGNTGYFPNPQAPTGWSHGLWGPFVQNGTVSLPDNTGMTNGVNPEAESDWLYHAISSASIARRILAADPRVNPGEIGVMGISWGGVITSLLIGYDPSFAFAIPVYGSGYLTPEVTLGSISAHFSHETVRERYLAEDRFSQVRTSVLWQCWNDDNNFSIQANSRSFLDTASSGLTVLSIVHDMFHSHRDAWKRPEPFVFADAVLDRGPAFPRLQAQPEGRSFCIDLAWDHAFSATIYYITTPMEYRVHNKYGRGAHLYMAQQWQTMPCQVKGTQICGTLPDDVAGYYVEVKTRVAGKDFILSSVYVELFRTEVPQNN